MGCSLKNFKVGEWKATTMCFPYGMEVEEKKNRGTGTPVTVEIIEEES